MSQVSTDVRDVINKGAMSRFQVVAVTICVTLNMLDGFDVLVMAFTASEVSAEWNLTGAQLGVLLSAGLFGMAGGSLFLAPWGDRFGRRALTLFCLTLITVGMLLSSAAQDATQLAVLRVLTGLGIGGMLASLNVITAEYSSDKWRSTAISIQATGYPIGATIGGTIAAVFITYYGWRSVFLFGALVTAAMIPVVMLRLPESLDFLLARRPANALEKLNALLRRMNRDAIAQLADPSLAARSDGQGRLRKILSRPFMHSTLCIWISFFLVMFSFYFVLSWTPKLLVAAGLSTQQGITGGVLLNVGGIVGGTAFGLLAARFKLKTLETVYLLSTTAAIALFGLLAGGLTWAFPVALAIGVFLFGSMVGLYAITPLTLSGCHSHDRHGLGDRHGARRRHPGAIDRWIPGRSRLGYAASLLRVRSADGRGGAVGSSAETQLMKLSTERILTTHVGSLPRTQAVVDFLFKKENGGSYDAQSFDRTMADAVRQIVRRQVSIGLDVISDGETSKIGYV